MFKRVLRQVPFTVLFLLFMMTVVDILKVSAMNP